MKLDFRRPGRVPLLMIAGAEDRIVPAKVVRRNHNAYAGSSARTDLIEFPGRVHWIIAQEGWQDVAYHIAGWLELVDGPDGA